MLPGTCFVGLVIIPGRVARFRYDFALVSTSRLDKALRRLEQPTVLILLLSVTKQV